MKKYLFFLSLLILLNVSNVAHAAGDWSFDDRMTYDIYLYSYPDHSSVVKDVKILRLEQMGDTTFLVIRSTGFRIKDSPGFIRLDAVAAILPNSESYLQNGQRLEVQH